MALIDELQPASFKGAKFIVTAARLSGGRKDIKHSFPNSNKQTIEDLGLAPRVFSLTAVVTGNNYIQDRDRLLSVLEEGGKGTLIHPFYGRLDNYVARSYTLSENMSALGEAKFNIVFEINNDPGPPIKSQNTLSIIESGNNTYIGAVSSDINDNYSVTPSFTGNFSSASGKLDDVGTAFNSNTSLVQASSGQVNEFQKQLNKFGIDTNFLLQNPSELSTDLLALFDTVDSLYTDIPSTIAVLEKFFNFGDDDIEINLTTIGRIERNNNNLIINQSVQSVALSYAYFNTAQIDFETTSEIDSLANRLETQYQKLIIAEGLQSETLDDLTNLRADMQGFFNDQRIRARQIITVNVNTISARLLAYKFYGESSQGEQILELNNVKQNVNFLQGNIDILTE